MIVFCRRVKLLENRRLVSLHSTVAVQKSKMKIVGVHCEITAPTAEGYDRKKLNSSNKNNLNINNIVIRSTKTKSNIKCGVESITSPPQISRTYPNMLISCSWVDIKLQQRAAF